MVFYRIFLLVKVMCCKSEIYKSIEKAIGCWQTFSPDVTFFFRIKMNIAVFQVREFFSDKGHELKENFVASE